MPSTTLLDIPPAEQAQMRAIHRRAIWLSVVACPDRAVCSTTPLSAPDEAHDAGARRWAALTVFALRALQGLPF